MAITQPKDQSHFILPDLGEGVHEAELLEWKVKPGERVEEHQTLAEMETDKARVEVPSPWSGVVKTLNGNEGDILTVGSILVTYDVGSSAEPAPEVKSAVAGDKGEDAGTVVGSVDSGLTVSSQFTRRRDEDNGAVAPDGKALATPAVRRIARDAGIDINRVPGTGRGGRVTASDIAGFSGDGPPAVAPAPIHEPPAPPEFVPAAPVAAPAAAPAVAVSGEGVSKRIPIRGIRRAIAQALDHSVKTAVHYTVVDEADVTQLIKKRSELIFATGEKISLLPFLMTAVCRALQKHPSLNAIVDDAKQEILLKNVVNLGIAVDTEHGLMVPVLSAADRSSIVELGRRVKDVATRCQSRTIPRDELTGGTFTISNVGSYGGMFTTPIINYPEVAILAAGRTRERVVARDGMFALGSVMPLSLSCDHRVVDGAEATRFLNTVLGLLEHPDQLVQPA